MMGLDQTATVYGEDPITGRYNAVLKSGLQCRMAHLNLRNMANATDRAELAGRRRLLWDADFEMPENAQILIDDTRWQAVGGTFAAMRGPSGAVAFRAAEVIRQL